MIFKHLRWIAIHLTFSLFWVPAHAQSTNLSFKTSIEKELNVLKEQPNSKIDILEALLLVSRHWDPSIKAQPLRDEIIHLVSDVRKILQGSNQAKDLVRSLRLAIHDKAGYRYTDKVDARGIPVNNEELFLHGMLKTKRGYCMNLSLLYLILGQKLDIPLFGVPLPNHFFVRYQKDGHQINIETTEGGSLFPDSFYRQRYLSPSEKSNSYFLKNLNAKKTLGAYFSNIGMVYYQNHKMDQAVFYLRMSTKINPRSIDAQNNLANIFSEQKKFKEAIQHYQLALKASPGNISTLFNLGLAYQEKGDIQAAIENFMQVVQIDKTYTPAHQRLANLFLNKKKLISSLLHLKILAKMQPENIQNKINIANAFGKLGQHPLAVQAFKAILNRYPDNEKIHSGLAETYYRMDDFPHAIEQYRYLIDQNPDDLKNYIQLGWTYYRTNDLSMASSWTIRGLNKSINKESFSTLAMMNLGFYALLQKEYVNAKKWYGKALAGNPSKIAESMISDIQSSSHSQRADLKFFSGWIYSKTNQMEKAKTYLQAYLNLEKNGKFAEEAKSLLGINNKKNTNYLKKTSDLSTQNSIPVEMVLISAGFFKMGLDNSLDDEGPEHKVFLDSFYIDKYEVSTKDFSEFLNIKNNVKGYYLDNKFGTLIYNGVFKPRSGLDKFPINNVTWQAANEYCKWKDKRLPSEAEWEKAARGKNGNAYPWGNQPPSQKLARYDQTWTNDKKHQVLVPVDSFDKGKSPYGIYNMAGNVKEWVDDWYDREYYKEIDEYANPKGPIGGEFKVVRGGSWRDLKGFIYSSFRNNGNPKSRMDDYGFRCARSASPDSGPKKLTRLKIPANAG